MPSLLERFPQKVCPTIHDTRNRERALEKTCSSWPEGIRGTQKKVTASGYRNPDADTHVMAVSDICCNLDLIILKEANPQMYRLSEEIEITRTIYAQRQASVVHR